MTESLVILCDYCGLKITGDVHNVGDSWEVILACSDCVEPRK